MKNENYTGKSLYRNTKDMWEGNSCCRLGTHGQRFKGFGFIELNDGSFFKNLQIVFEEKNLPNFKEIAKLSVGSAIIAHGELVETPGAKQPFELKATKIEIEGASTPDYPLQRRGTLLST